MTSTLSSKMFDVPHRYAVMTSPDRLRSVLSKHRNLWKVVMDSAIKALNDTLSYALRKEILVSAIIVLHPFARDLGFNLHIHPLITEGGFDKSGKFIHKKFIPFKALRRTWQYQVLTNLKKALPKTKENAMLIDRLFPERQFKMIWYYGAYCRKWKSRYKRYLSHSSIRQCKIEEFTDKSWPRCPKCGSRMEFEMFFKKDPPIIPAKWEFCTKLDDWSYLCAI